ncbi:MAG: FKBP-type peptidyl-prolyl cis-trans isomerase [Flavobacteriales bacterium]|nr:FKBP-type peptidyl-prolyl cis-trans isomerase [Flavobacteriales bacterium]
MNVVAHRLRHCRERSNLLVLLVLLFSVFSSCNTQPTQKGEVNPEKYKQPLMDANKTLVEIEQQDIDNYVTRMGWEMIETGSGLRYLIYEHGNGRKVEEGLVVQCAYESGLLTGKKCYNSDDFGPKEFLVGRGGVESGLEEVVLLLREGDRVKIILPSHLAFGLVGDDDCIPKKAVVVYDLEMKNVLNPINRN